jgi:hypothetical protein
MLLVFPFELCVVGLECYYIIFITCNVFCRGRFIDLVERNINVALGAINRPLYVRVTIVTLF